MRPPTGSSTSAPKAATAAARSSPPARPRTSPPSSAATPGSFSNRCWRAASASAASRRRSDLLSVTQQVRRRRTRGAHAALSRCLRSRPSRPRRGKVVEIWALRSSFRRWKRYGLASLVPGTQRKLLRSHNVCDSFWYLASAPVSAFV